MSRLAVCGIAAALPILAGGCAAVKSEKAGPGTECGKLVDIQHIRAGWSQSEMSRVVTDRGVFLVEGDMSGFKGRRVWISKRGTLFIDGTPYGKEADGFFDYQQ